MWLNHVICGLWSCGPLRCDEWLGHFVNSDHSIPLYNCCICSGCAYWLTVSLVEHLADTLWFSLVPREVKWSLAEVDAFNSAYPFACAYRVLPCLCIIGAIRACYIVIVFVQRTLLLLHRITAWHSASVPSFSFWGLIFGPFNFIYNYHLWFWVRKLVMHWCIWEGMRHWRQPSLSPFLIIFLICSMWAISLMGPEKGRDFNTPIEVEIGCKFHLVQFRIVTLSEVIALQWL